VSLTQTPSKCVAEPLCAADLCCKHGLLPPGMEREQPSPLLLSPQQPPWLYRLRAGKASLPPYQSPGHPNPPINESYYTDIFLKACPSLQPGSPVPAIGALIFRRVVSGAEVLPPIRAGFEPGEDLTRPFLSCAVVRAQVSPITPGCRTRLSPTAMPGSPGSARLPCGKRQGSGRDARRGELGSHKGNVPR